MIGDFEKKLAFSNPSFSFFQAFMTGNAEILRLLLQHRIDEDDENFDDDDDDDDDDDKNTRYPLRKPTQLRQQLQILPLVTATGLFP